MKLKLDQDFWSRLVSVQVFVRSRCLVVRLGASAGPPEHHNFPIGQLVTSSPVSADFVVHGGSGAVGPLGCWLRVYSCTVRSYGWYKDHWDPGVVVDLDS